MGQTKWIKHLVAWTLWTLILLGLQTTVWPLIFGTTAAPQLWLNVILYFILYRPPLRALFLAYALGLLIAPFSSLALGVYWTTMLLIVPLGSSLKERTFWPGNRYFIAGSFLLIGAWHVTTFVVSQITEGNPASLHLLPRLTEIVLTPLAAAPQLRLMIQMDKLLQDEPPPEFEGIHE